MLGGIYSSSNTLILSPNIEKVLWKMSESGVFFEILVHDNYEQNF